MAAQETRPAGDTAMLEEPSSDREAKPLSAALIGDLLRLADLVTVGSVALVVYAAGGFVDLQQGLVLLTGHDAVDVSQADEIRSPRRSSVR